LDSTSRNARHVYLIGAYGGKPWRLTNRAATEVRYAAAQCHSFQFDIRATIQSSNREMLNRYHMNPLPVPADRLRSDGRPEFTTF
jgi:hypothetical protein